MRALLQATWTALLGTFIGLLVSVKASAGVVALVGVAFVLALAYWLLTDRPATVRFPLLARLPGAAAQPRLRLDPPRVHRAPVVAQARAGGPVGVPEFEADYVKVPVTNDRGAPVAAEDVQAWLDFEGADATPIAQGVQARWAHTEQAPDRSQFARLDDPALNEVRIPAGSTRHLDVVACADELGGFRMWTNESMQMLGHPKFALGDGEVVATVTVRGSNTREKTVRLRLTRVADGVKISTDR